jgi:hypothetical protein
MGSLRDARATITVAAVAANRATGLATGSTAAADDYSGRESAKRACGSDRLDCGRVGTAQCPRAWDRARG